MCRSPMRRLPNAKYIIRRFPYGYGLDYAHPRDIGTLPEAPTEISDRRTNGRGRTLI